MPDNNVHFMHKGPKESAGLCQPTAEHVAAQNTVVKNKDCHSCVLCVINSKASKTNCSRESLCAKDYKSIAIS